MNRRNVIGVLLALVLALSGCARTPAPTGSAAPSPSATAPATGLSFTPGVYEGEGQGYVGAIKVAVTVDAASVTAIEVTEQSETEAIGGVALPKLTDAVLAGQTLAVDAVSGATATSDGFLAAVADALGKSGVDMDAIAAGQSGEVGTEKEAVTLESQVVVVGAGGAGLAAALTAAQNGAEVLVLEKMGIAGGASSMAGGGTNATGSQWLKDEGIEDSPELLFMDLMRNGHFTNDAATLWLYARTVGPAFDWLVAEDGAALPYVKKTPTPSAEHRVGRTYSPEGGGSGVVNALLAKCEAEGVTVMTETPAHELITEGGKVVGVKALGSDGTPYVIKAGKVVLATGGFGADAEAMPDYVKGLPYAGAVSATGDGLKMATAVGAATLNLDKVNIQPHSIILPNGRGQHTFQGVLAMYGGTGSILVSDQGERFVNERGSADAIKQAMMDNEHSYLIMDAESFAKYTEVCIASRNYTQEQLDQFLAANGSSDPVFVKGESLDELAATLSMPAGALLGAVERYNGFAAAGEDADFGRAVTKPMAGEGPFYAVEMHLRYYATLGGLRVNDDMQVLDGSGAPIDGLYAAGEVVGGALGDIYAPGALFGWAMASGHNAGLSVTKD